MYQDTEAFGHYSRNPPEAKQIGLLNFTCLGEKNKENLKDKKIARKKHGNHGEKKRSDKNDPNRAKLQSGFGHKPLNHSMVGLSQKRGSSYAGKGFGSLLSESIFSKFSKI